MAVIILAVDLRSKFGLVRNQGQRPTCLAFAMSDAHSAAREKLDALSTKFAFFHAQKRSGRSPTQGALLSAMLDALRMDGQPLDSGWPYSANHPDSSSWSPPSNVGQLFKRDGASQLRNVDQLIHELSNGKCVVVILHLSKSFYQPTSDGIVGRDVGELPEPARSHAVVAVGHGTVDGDRAILIRNSWGPAWGLNGHAWLTEAFLKTSIKNSAKMLAEV